MKKIGLVLEGGGMRGAYTAGALAWLIDQHIELDYGVGISAGAMNLCSYAMKDKDYLYDVSVRHMSDKRNVGMVPLFKEGTYVGYNFMFDDLLRNEVKYDIPRLKKSAMDLDIGIYDLEDKKTVWLKKEQLDDNLRLLKGACTLPIAGNIVDYEGKRYIDGGVTTMVPIRRSLDNQCEKHIVIITKAASYVRKPSGKMLLTMTKLNYRKYPALCDALKERSDVYYKEMQIVEDLVEKGNALLFRPTVSLPVKRFSGDAEALKQLYALGYKDMEDRREEILKFINK